MAEGLESRDQIDWQLDLKTGEVLPITNSEFCDDEDLIVKRIENDPDRYCNLQGIEFRDAFRMLEAFVEELEGGEARRSLERALRMRRPFRCFKDTLIDFLEVRERWFAFKDDRMESYAREFLEAKGIEFEEVDKPIPMTFDS